MTHEETAPALRVRRQVIFIQDNVLEDVIYEMTTMLSRH